MPKIEEGKYYMEKKAFRIGILSGIMAVFLFSLSSCTFEITEKKRIADPDVINTSNGITITLKNSNSDTMHINIFRQDVTNLINDNGTSDEPVINIGIVFPYMKGKENSTNNNTFTFEDENVIKGHKYRYCARLYSEADGYTYTNWTSPIKVINGITSETTRISYGVPQSTKFVYDAAAKTITINGNITNPVGFEDKGTDYFKNNYKPALVFSNNKETRVFEVESLENETVIYLSGLFPQDFHDVEVTFLGIIAQKVVSEIVPKTKETIIQRIIWTEITSLTNSGQNKPFVDKKGDAVEGNKIFLESQYGQSGYDYAPYSFN